MIHFVDFAKIDHANVGVAPAQRVVADGIAAYHSPKQVAHRRNKQSLYSHQNTSA